MACRDNAVAVVFLPGLLFRKKSTLFRKREQKEKRNDVRIVKKGRCLVKWSISKFLKNLKLILISYYSLNFHSSPFSNIFLAAERCETVNEAVAIAVGSILAITTVLLIVGYAIYRYVKVKKVHYNTMEWIIYEQPTMRGECHFSRT